MPVALLATVTETVAESPQLSLTVTVVVPRDTPVTESVLPLTETVATDVLLEMALYGPVPPLMVHEPV